eukprot:355524-Chlamydomonas_euryale.AAC.46
MPRRSASSTSAAASGCRPSFARKQRSGSLTMTKSPLFKSDVATTPRPFPARVHASWLSTPCMQAGSAQRACNQAGHSVHATRPGTACMQPGWARCACNPDGHSMHATRMGNSAVHM